MLELSFVESSFTNHIDYYNTTFVQSFYFTSQLKGTVYTLFIYFSLKKNKKITNFTVFFVKKL